MSDNMRRVLIVAAVAVFGVMLFGVDRLIATREADHINSRVTRIESPCQRYGSDSQLCQQAFETAVKSINHRIACYIDRKSGRPFKPSCRGVRLRVEGSALGNGGHAQTSVPDSGTGNGGDASNPQQGSSQPGPHEGGGGESNIAPEGGGHKKSSEKLPPSDDEGGNPTSSSPSSSRTGSTVESTKEVPVEAPIGEAVGGVVEEVGATVTGTVEGVTEPVCTLTKLLC